ncbi:hypothetical protein MMC28_010800 [Mycoblastus sanguinarius]|nr:hypothetical protein [Mycoblastus sanguinarius]
MHNIFVSSLFVLSATAAVLKRQEGGSCYDIPWLANVPAGVPVNIPGVVSNGVHLSCTGSSSSNGAPSTPLPVVSSTTPSIGEEASTISTGSPSQTPTPAPASSSLSNTSNSSSSPSSGAPGCPPNFKGVTFNGGYSVSQFDKIGAAADWITFGLTISGTPTEKDTQGHIPMMAFATDVSAAVTMVNSDNPPEWMLTFNEPDFAYAGTSPTMSPQQAADAIQPLLKSPGKGTKFVAPVTADPTSDWLPQFYQACGCQSFFSAYNIHIYLPTAGQVTDDLSAFHTKFSDKPIWLTEIAPGNANPACSISWDAAGDFMNQVFKWSKNSRFVDRVFWNSGNQIGGGDTNVCNSYLLDSSDNPSPLLTTFQNVDCS